MSILELAQAIERRQTSYFCGTCGPTNFEGNKMECDAFQKEMKRLHKHKHKISLKNRLLNLVRR